MKKILLSVSIIMLVAAASVGITASYFSDTEKSVGNTLSVGTIDISINDQNPWSQQFALKDMKPGYTDYINFEVQNAGPSFFFQAEDGIRDWSVTGVQTCALPI